MAELDVGGVDMRVSHGLGIRGLSDSDSPNIVQVLVPRSSSSFVFSKGEIMYSSDHCKGFGKVKRYLWILISRKLVESWKFHLSEHDSKL